MATATAEKITISTQDVRVYNSQLTKDSRRILSLKTRSIKRSLTSIQSSIVELGRHLKQAKLIVGHGFFGLYLKEEVGISRDTADRMILVADAVDEGKLSRNQIQSLSKTSLYYLVKESTPESAKEEIFGMLEDAGSVSTDTVCEIITRHRQSSGSEAEYKQKTLSQILDKLARIREKLEPFDDTLAIVKGIAKVEDDIYEHLVNMNRNADRKSTGLN